MSAVDDLPTVTRERADAAIRKKAWHHRLGLRSRFFLLFNLITLSAMGVVGYFGYLSASSAYLSKATELVAGYTSEAANKMDIFQGLPRSDLAYFSTYHPLLNYLHWTELRDEERKEYWSAMVAEAMRQYATANPYDYKILFIDTEGNERIVVKRDLQSGKVRYVPEGELQNRKGTDYFIRGMQLSPGELYASGLSLATEHGQLEKPMVPLVQFTAPIFGGNNVRHGVLVVNVLADYYFRYVREANAVDPNRRFYLIGSDGEYYFHPEEGKSFGRTLGHDASFATDYPGLLDQVLRFETQHSQSAHNKIFSFRHIHPNPGRHENGFILVGVAEESVVLAEQRAFVHTFALIVMLVVVGVLLSVHLFMGRLMRPLLFVSRQLQHLGRGETSEEEIDYQEEDEIGQMLALTRTLTAAMERVAVQVDIISHGEFGNELPLLSQQDRLGKAINNMTRMLREARQQEQRSNWLKDGVNQLNQALTGDLSPQELADTAISLVGRYLEAGRGVFYRHHKERQELDLLGSYMFTEREALGNRFHLSEGAVGQVARERKPIILHAVAADAPIVTGTLNQPPGHTYTFPLLREGELLGVIELASFERFDGVRLEFLARAIEVIAAFLYTVEQREQIHQLLTFSEEATRQAQEQAGNLELANARLEEQQQQLQMQTEELQQTNTQMEEQQQQLQQQSAILRRNNEDLSLSRQELDQRARQLEESNRYKSEFLANMSHELRTPLNSIIVLSKMLAANEQHDREPERIKHAQIIHAAGQELLRLIDDILDLSKIEAGRVDMLWESFPVSELVREWQEMFVPCAVDKSLAFVVDDQYRGQLTTDRHKLSQVVRNLLANAFKFTSQGQVDLLLQPNPSQADQLLIQVRDTGIGIPADKQRLIFEEFQQVDGTISRQFGGTGLGLSISRRLLEMLGGGISVESQEGQGSRFTVHLPIQYRGSEQPLPGALPGPLPSGSRCQDDRARLTWGERPILIIDDDPSFCETVIQLNRHLGHKTIAAGNGAEGLQLARDHHPLGIVLDLGLPDQSGMAVLDQLKISHELRAIPVYIVSGREKEVEWQRRGAVGFLHKPVDSRALSTMMNSFRSGEESPARVLMMVDGLLNREIVDGLAALQNVEMVQVADVEGAVAALQADHETPFSVVVVSDRCFREGTSLPAFCQRLRQIRADLPFIVLCDAPLNEEEEMAMRLYTDTIIRQSPQANARLLADVERFLSGIRSPEPFPGLSIPPRGEMQPTALTGRTFLVVDDDTRNLFVITAALESHGGRVLQAVNGRKAMALLAQERVDLVLTDIMMPEMNGTRPSKPSVPMPGCGICRSSPSPPRR
ncbi:MAG: ATP-binding protein [Magnetococcus sp. XQGC-1]